MKHLRRTSVVIISLLVALVLFLTSTMSVLADKGGVPNQKAANGAAHANENSAHYPPPEPPPGDTGNGI
jgi:hypothetical protein